MARSPQEKVGLTRRRSAFVATATAAVCAMSLPAAANASETPRTVQRPDHVVVVVEENHSYSHIINSRSAPYINSLARKGALFTRSYATSHPSEPNYLELFSGSAQGVRDDSCPHTFTAPNLGSELIAAHRSFTGYSESMPADGYSGCYRGSYARKHNPWVNFKNVPRASNRTLAAFPSDFTKLPTVSFVVPNLMDDMHDGTIKQGDTWLRTHLNRYATWAATHNSILIVTWDEDDQSQSNRIPTIITGAHIKPGTYSEHITHDNVLRTLEDAYALPHAGHSATATPITDIWTTTP